MTTDWDHHLEEYKLCEEARHHHERTMWQLLGFYLAVTGVLLNFWLQADPFTEVAQRSNSFLILFVPFFLGIFTAGALLKHKFFWRLELRRAVELEKLLEFNRERAFLPELYSSPLRFLRSGEMALLAVVLTVIGIGYLIGRSLWFKLPTAPGGHFWFPIFMASIPAGVTAYGAYRIWMVDRERHIESGTPKPVRVAVSRTPILCGIAFGFLGSILLWWSLELALETSRSGGTLEWSWLGLWQAQASMILLGLLFVMSTYFLLHKGPQPMAGSTESRDTMPPVGKNG